MIDGDTGAFTRHQHSPAALEKPQSRIPGDSGRPQGSPQRCLKGETTRKRQGGRPEICHESLNYLGYYTADILNHPAKKNLFAIAEDQSGYFTRKQATSAGFDAKTHAYHI